MNKILTDQTWASIASEIRIKASYMRLATQQLQCVVWSVRLCISIASTIRLMLGINGCWMQTRGFPSIRASMNM